VKPIYALTYIQGVTSPSARQLPGGIGGASGAASAPSPAGGTTLAKK
jgi:hypothetical protein